MCYINADYRALLAQDTDPMPSPENFEPTQTRLERGQIRRNRRDLIVSAFATVAVAGGVVIALICQTNHDKNPDTLFPPDESTIQPFNPDFPEQPVPAEPPQNERFIQADGPAAISIGLLESHSA